MAQRTVFLDTSFVIALENKDDPHRSRVDKEWGLTDCLSFVLMKHEGVTEARTADIHFRQAGFKALLLEAP